MNLQITKGLSLNYRTMSQKSGAHLGPDFLKNTQELATQAALRAKEMQHKSSAQSSSDQMRVPEIPARSHDVPKAPEIPPKRSNYKKIDGEIVSNDDLISLPQRCQGPQKAPPVPQKPSSLQNSPLMAPKFKEKISNSPLLSRSQLIKGNNLSTNQTEKPTINASKKFSVVDDKLKNASKAGQSKPIKPPSLMEEYGSEDALRGIESGLRNMERAMQEQMNLRSFEAAAAAAAENHQRQFNIIDLKQNIRGMGSVTSLDGSQNLRGLENIRLNIDQKYIQNTRGNGMERVISMDQMRLDNFSDNMRSLESNPNIRSILDNPIENLNQRSVEHHFRSLDRYLPLEVQYSRQRSQEMEYIRQQLLPVIARNNENALNRQGGLSKEDLRLRRRSSHDETQYSQQNNQVSRMREQWDDTSQSVLQRKSQLTAMLGDSQRYEAKRIEIENWLSRMESRSERMGVVASTADVLEVQQKDQKSFHAELHQYKHHIELFNQLTQKLIAVYPSDDTSRIKRMTESVNLRYNNLNNAVVSRGKMLHAAVHSLQSFDRTLDQFQGWLSEAESLCENTESEIDRNPHAYKDLQSEIESHRVVYDRLDNTGRKLLGSLTSQEDAVMLQRRLDEMNQRWNHLKSKSIAIRNRLESNSEHWNALLLSLRELIEWVIRKDTELTSLGIGPMKGDAASLQKQMDDHRAFRRQLEDKRPVVESNLLSGRQYVSNEPPLSDTSDSEGDYKPYFLF
ncbi:dystrophin-like isoform X2 [Ochlerotatus camptorhynchus]|uniref:dystrophin-like isoform X2 n=1 Tax=Ochlerotatus camptorhynchus TaxID=644619 RepID=UPI0031CF73EC